MPPRFVLPCIDQTRGPLFWIRPAHWWVGRRKFFRPDHSNEWRYEFHRDTLATKPPVGYPSDPDARTRPYSWLLGGPRPGGFSFVVLGDTGEGDASQYALLPLIRALAPDFMIINGDVAYPAGNFDDYKIGFFEPYRDLNIPIWAVPGNHEYYSDGRGREFFDVFCSTVAATEWEEHGLVLKPQPGSYWELGEPGTPLVVLGVDSGQSGALDGKKGFLSLMKRKDDADQHKWLESRLRAAAKRKASVVILFHIPKLVDATSKKKIGLARLHAILSRYGCVKLVITAHIHNLQCYDPGTFERFLADLTKVPPETRATYLVSGGGGAYIGSTEVDGPYPPAQCYPTPKKFEELSRTGQEVIHKLGIEKTIGGDILAGVGGLVGWIGPAEKTDADQMKMLSLIHCDCRPGQPVTVTPYYFDDLAELYPEWPDRTPVYVQNGHPALSVAARDRCRVAPPILL
jgi:hypothetical protein